MRDEPSSASLFRAVALGREEEATPAAALAEEDESCILDRQHQRRPSPLEVHMYVWPGRVKYDVATGSALTSTVDYICQEVKLRYGKVR